METNSASQSAHDDAVPTYSLADRYRLTEGRVLLTGIQALARIPIEQLRRDQAAGLNTAAFLSGYPGSPLGGFDQEVARALRAVPELPIVHQPAVNEELGATSVMGSQLVEARADARYDGVVGIWYGKAPGLDRAGDALRHGVFAGSSRHGGAVVLVGDDPASKSSTMPSSSDATLVDLHMPVFYPGTIAECLELGLHAVALSRASGLWSSMKIVTPIADGSGTVTLPVLGDEPVIPTVEVDGASWISHPSARFLGQRMVDVEREFREVRMPLALRYGAENGLNRVTIDAPDAWIGLVATGFTYREVLESLRRLGLDSERAIADAGIRVLQFRMPVPFNPETVRSFARGLREIVVIEEKNATLESLVKDALYGSSDQPLVVGKQHHDGRTLMRSWGQLDADAIMPGLRERLSARLADRLVPEPPTPRTKSLIPLTVNRTPFFCSGCPHNWGTKVPEGALVGAGTGCHGMILLMDEERVGEGIGLTAMGNEGAQWIGMEPFIDADHVFQNYGDGTFFHSGQLAVQYCIGAGKNVTFKILYNSTVAMTGGQDATFQMEVPALAATLVAQGATKVAITAADVDRYDGVDLPSGVEVHDRDDIVAVQADLRATPGVTVLIHDQECAAEVRRDRRRDLKPTPTTRVVINHRICEGCGDCGDVSNCLSVQPLDTPLGRKTTIDQHSCNFDYSCLKGDCPAFMTVETSDPARRGRGGASAATAWTAAEPAEPTFDAARPAHHIRMAGIGGTGVVTVAQILATAAMFDGWEVRGLDQTGLSQKAGPVISDVVLARPDTIVSNLIGEGQADLILGFDGMVAAADRTIEASHGDTTAVVASTHRTPTGGMISKPATPYPADSIEARLAAVADPTVSRFLDTTALSIALLGSAAYANVMLLGVAFQAGQVPVSSASISHAIELNGVAVQANRAAFDWGRRWVHDPAGVEAAVGAASVGAAAAPRVDVPELPRKLARRLDEIVAGLDGDTGSLAQVLVMLAGDLVAYQDAKYATRFLESVSRAAGHEQRVAPHSLRLTETVARSLHKLLAYKDEYEVARLMLAPDGLAEAAAVGGADPEITWQLHPPMLKALGVDDKLGFGPRSTPAFRALARGKRLRGTRLDPFGYTELRGLERELPGEFESAMSTVYEHLTAANLDAAIEIAGLPDLVRGYEDLKLRRIAEYRSALTAHLQALTN